MAGASGQSEKRAAVEAGVLRATGELLREGASYAELVWMTERTFHEQTVGAARLDPEALVDALAAVWSRAVYGAA